jgi:hypothetical protein
MAGMREAIPEKLGTPLAKPPLIETGILRSYHPRSRSASLPPRETCIRLKEKGDDGN